MKPLTVSEIVSKIHLCLPSSGGVYWQNLCSSTKQNRFCSVIANQPSVFLQFNGRGGGGGGGGGFGMGRGGGPPGRGGGRGRGGPFPPGGPGRGGGPGGMGRGGFGDPNFQDQTQYGVPADKCGLVIGKGG